MARIVVRHKDFGRCREAAQRLADGLAGPGMPRARLRGPAPCPIARIAGRHRQQIEILARSASELQDLLTEARRRGMLHNLETTAVDVDPIALL